LLECGEGAAIEIYDRTRFLTLTGHRLKQSPTSIKRRQRIVNDFLLEFFPAPVVTPAPANTQALNITDQAVIDIACAASNGAKFAALYFDGDLSEHGFDHSSADLALLSHLAFYSGNAEQVERIFGTSALGQRDKWTTRPDYRKRSIAKAFLDRTDFYEPGYHIKTLMRSR